MNYREAWANGEIEAGTLVDRIEEQAREIAGLQKLLDRAHMRMDELKAQPSGVVLPERKQDSPSWGYDMGGNYDEGHADGWNQALDEVARLNHSSSAGDGQSEEGLEEWAKGKFGIGGRYIGKLYGNTDWALARAVWSAALSRAALSANHSEQVLVPRVATPEMKEAIWAELDRQGFDSDLVETQSLYFAGIAAAPSAGSQGGDV